MTPEERIVRLETQMADQRDDMRRVMAKLDELTAAANQGRGMLAMLVTGGAIAGGFVTWLIGIIPHGVK
jgi:hypothetical protein